MENDSENVVLCEKIINEINAVFVKDTDLASFAIIPSSAEQKNRSPVLHEDHNLGLESWCAKHVFIYAHQQILSLKTTNRYFCNDSIIKYVNIALLINPDVTTFWHIRRTLVEKTKLDLHKEFKFSELVLTVKPKSNEAFSYRRWLFSFRSCESIDWSFEISICDRCSDKSSSNYHAWTHRQWVIQKAPHLLKSEVIMTEKFIKKHISDYSCYYYRQFILKKMFEVRFYDKEQEDLKPLKEFLNFYLIDCIKTSNDILDTLLPDIDLKKIDENVIRTLLFCCNIAAYDIKFCDESKKFYGQFESFDCHRRASLKFIVDSCKELKNNLRYKVHNNKSNNNKQRVINDSRKMKSNDSQHSVNIKLDNGLKKDCQKNNQVEEPLTKVTKFENNFLSALKKSEGSLGEKHRRWCSIFLGFDYSQ